MHKRCAELCPKYFATFLSSATLRFIFPMTTPLASYTQALGVDAPFKPKDCISRDSKCDKIYLMGQK